MSTTHSVVTLERGVLAPHTERERERDGEGGRVCERVRVRYREDKGRQSEQSIV